MSDQLTPALLIPYDAAGEALEDDRAIALDFNPESLSLKVQAGEEVDRHRLGNQQTQHVAKSTATLSFDAVFDTTRPNAARGRTGEEPASPEKLDVRVKTAAIAALLQAEGEGENSAPRRVRFHWGNIIFDGLIKSFAETLDYFSPEGVPLRSKLSLSITEQDFRYNVDADQVQRAAATPGVNQAGALAAANDLDSLFDLSAGAGFKLDLSLDLDLQLELELDLQVGFDAEIALDAELGFNADFDVGLGAGVELDLSAAAALDLFGDAAIAAGLGVGAGVDLGAAVGAKASRAATSPAAPADAARPPSAWAPQGPQPGSRASQLAGHLNRARAGAASASQARGDPRPAAPLPVRGSPPLRPASFGPAPTPGLFVARQQVGPAPRIDTARPAWEVLPGPAPQPGGDPGRSRNCCDSQRKPHGQH